MEENDLIRVRIDESKQKEIFTKFIDDFNKDFSLASSYLGINNFSLSRYKRAVSKYIPKDIFLKVVEHLNLEQPDILYSGTLNEIRGHYMRKAHSALEEKYGENWAKELTVRRDFKGIRLSDFPDYLFIYLEEIYRQDLFESLFNLFGSMDKTASFLGVSTSRLFFWRNGVQKDYLADKDGLQFIPLDKLRLISQTLVKDYRDEFSMENLEKHVTMYRMRAGNPIRNPNLPIKESPAFIRLLFHLLGDGYSGGSSDSANYRNTCKELLSEFKEDLKIFGDVPVYEGDKCIKFPRALAKVIENFYGVNSRTFDSRITSKILQIPREDVCFGIRAFSDDEGSVYSHSVRLSSANYDLLMGVKTILGNLKLRCSAVKSQNNIRATFGKTYYLDINDLEKYRKLIGFTHPKKKALLEKYAKAIKHRRRIRLFKS